MASWAVLGVPTVACGVGAVTMMSASKAQSKKASGGGGGGLLDWLNGVLDKETFSEMDPVLQRPEDAPKKPAASPPPKSKQNPSSSGGGGGGLFGLFGKK